LTKSSDITVSALSGASTIPANMASKVTIDASATSKPKPSIAPPIEPLKNDVARLYTHVHPVLVLSMYAYKFKDIVADPVPALLGILAPLAVLQIAYLTICLPPTGETPKVKKSKPGEKKKQASGVLETGVNGKILVWWNHPGL
jgi:phosphatidylinositol glycan class F